MLGFDFEIFYKLGCENKVADGLSRSMINASMLFILTVPMVLQWEDLYKEIAEEKEIQEVLLQLQNKTLSFSKFTVIDGRLWSKQRLVISQQPKFIPLILRECHDNKIGDHSGVLKTIHRVQ